MDNPEVFLTSLVVVSAKLLYSLDGIERSPISNEDPRRTKINWDQWQEIIAEKPLAKCANLLRGEEYRITASDTMTMETTKLDDYMDWFERMWIDDGEPKSKSNRR